jgi:DNA-directed RNA polymerase subunit RPC12/RpoP
MYHCAHCDFSFSSQQTQGERCPYCETFIAYEEGSCDLCHTVRALPDDDYCQGCRTKTDREEALADCPPKLRAELDRDLANALNVGRMFDSIFGMARR